VTPATRQEDIRSPLDFWWGDLSSWELIKALWCPDPDGRPAVASIMAHLATPNLRFDDTHIITGIDGPVYYSPVDQGEEPMYYEERFNYSLFL